MEKNSQDLFNGLILSGVQDLLSVSKNHSKTLSTLTKANRQTNNSLSLAFFVLGSLGIICFDLSSRQKRMEKELEELKRAKGE